MKVLITGGTGFIGSRLALSCLESGEEVRILAQTNSGAERENARLLTQRGAHLIFGSVSDPRTVKDAVAGADVSYHLAAAQHEANVPDQHFWDVNVEGTRIVAEAGLRAGVKRFVHGSTIGVYRAARDAIVTENSPLQPTNVYGSTKLEAERVVQTFSGRLSFVIARISETYGPGDRRLLKMFKGIQRHRFVPISRGQNLHHLIYIDDLVRALRCAAAIEEAPDHPVVLAGPRAITTSEMIDTIAAETHAKVLPFHLPMWPVWLLAIVMEKTLAPLRIPPPLYRRRLNFFALSYRFGASSSAALGFQPSVSPEEGLQRTAEWYRGEGWL